MSIFNVYVVACNPKAEGQITLPLAVLVDTGSELTWLPAAMLRGIGIEPASRQVFAGPGGLPVERQTGYVVLRSNGHQTMCEVVFAEPGDPTLLGTRALEGFGVPIGDNHFLSMTALAAFLANPLQKAA